MTNRQDKLWVQISAIIGAVICVVVAFLVFAPRSESVQGAVDVSMLPEVNAALNFISLCCLLLAIWFIKNGRENAHRRAIMCAVASSFGFLVSYIIYHLFKEAPRQYSGDFGYIYYPLLVVHIFLATTIVPAVIVTLRHGWNLNRERHKYLARRVMPLWLTVSVTGIAVYLMLL